jgi:hypothetical protein
MVLPERFDAAACQEFTFAPFFFYLRVAAYGRVWWLFRLCGLSSTILTIVSASELFDFCFRLHLALWSLDAYGSLDRVEECHDKRVAITVDR